MTALEELAQRGELTRARLAELLADAERHAAGEPALLAELGEARGFLDWLVNGGTGDQ